MQKIEILQKKLQQYSGKKWFFPLLLFLVMLLAYGLNLSRLGYYWDDWEALYFAKDPDLNSIWEYYKIDRPFAGLYYWIMFQIFGVGPVRWHIITFLVRYISYIGLYLSFSSIWKDANRWIQYAALLIAVFPGFTQSPMTLAYFRVYTSFAFLMLSFMLTIKALSVKKHAWLYHGGALLLSLFQCLLVEYFVLLEAVRLILLYFYFEHQNPEQFKENLNKSVRIYLPYALILFSYLIYRFVFFEKIFGIKNNNEMIFVNQIFQGNLKAFIDLVQYIIQDILSILFQSFIVLVDPEAIQGKGYIFLSFFLGLMVAIIIYLLYRPKSETSAQTNIQLMVVGFVTLVLGGIPIWLMGRQTFVGLWSDRFVLAPMLGVVILLAGFLAWIGPRSKRGALIMAAIIGLSVSFQVRNTTLYQQNWDQQQSFYWQLYWRVPALKEGSLIISPIMPLGYVSHYALGIATNYLYDQENLGQHPNYWFINSSRIFGVENVGKLVFDYPVNIGVRSISFEGDLSQVIGISNFTRAGRCLRVMDEPYDLFTPFSHFEDLEKQLYQLSQPERWIASDRDNIPPPDIFGEEPEHGWCFYFQKADLARQNQDWDTILTLYEQAAQLGLESTFAWEYVPVLMAYAMTEDWDSFETLSLQILGRSKAERFTDFVYYVNENSPDSLAKEIAIQRVLDAYDY